MDDVKTNARAASTWAPAKRGSIGKVHFNAPGDMWAYIKTMKGKKIEFEGKPYWFTVEKSLEERALAKKTNIGMKLLREKLKEQGKDTDDKDVLDGDWNRGMIWVNGEKVVTLSESRDALVIQESKWESAQVPLDKATFIEAVQ